MRTVRYKKGYSTAAAHMPQRALLCCCLAEGLAGAALAECVRPTLPPGQAADPADYSTAKPRARLSEWRQRGHRGVAAGVLSGGRRSFRVYECTLFRLFRPSLHSLYFSCVNYMSATSSLL